MDLKTFALCITFPCRVTIGDLKQHVVIVPQCLWVRNQGIAQLGCQIRVSWGCNQNVSQGGGLHEIQLEKIHFPTCSAVDSMWYLGAIGFTAACFFKARKEKERKTLEGERHSSKKGAMLFNCVHVMNCHTPLVTNTRRQGCWEPS